MKELLEKLRPTYDFILIDAPPMVSFVDSLTLAKKVDGILLVVRGGKTDREIA